VCLDALGRVGRPQHEDLLLEALRSDELAVSVAAARALGRAGTVAAVPALREATSSGVRGEMRSAARQAIAEIQARLTGAEPGQLSLAGAEAGALSLAGGEPGRLSLAEEPCHPEELRPGPATRDRQTS
jgi:HEAT repeat protein